MLNPFELLTPLCDGKFHSGEVLARQYGVSRMTVCKAIQSLAAKGVEFDALRGRGYRLRRPIDLLNADEIIQALNADIRSAIGGLEVLAEIDSTNAWLMREAAQDAPGGRVCLAESQSAGKGRRGRRWVSPFGANLYLSLLWRFDPCPREVAALGLLTGLAVAHVLESMGLADVRLKWPNDIVFQDRKLGGILLEMAGEIDGRCHVVIGVGINVAMPTGQAIDRPWTDLKTVLSGKLPGRNRLAAKIINALIANARDFERNGLQNLSALWKRYDGIDGRVVEVHTPDGCVFGTASGIDAQGRLLLNVDGESKTYASGEVSVRSRA